MNRYFLFITVLNMLINVIIFVPKILIVDRFHGAMMGSILSIPIGIGLTYFYTKAILRFPEKGFPEILANANHRKLKITYFGIVQFAYFSAGLITLVGFIDILNRFVNPEMPKMGLLAIYLAAILLIIQMPTERVMYLLEIVLFLNIPFISFIMFKAFTNEHISWDSVLEVATHVFEWPSIKSLAAATYIFSGYTNLIIFNRVIIGKVKMLNFIIVLILGAVNVFTSFLIPIGFHGADGAQQYLYPWISTADSLNLVYSPIERVFFLFMMFYMSITLMSVSVHWHVALELIKGTFKQTPSRKKIWLVLLAFICLSAAGLMYFNTVLLNKMTVYWMMARLGFEIIVVIVFSFWIRRKAA